MPELRARGGNTAAWAGALAWVVLPQLARAENAASFFNFAPADYFVIGAVLALPSALACVLVEAILPRKALPRWLTAIAVVVAVVSAALALAATKGTSPASLLFFLWFIVPPAAALALRGGVDVAAWRLAAGWAIAVMVFGLAVSRHPEFDIAMILLGGATPCLLAWTVTVLMLRQRGAFPARAAVTSTDRLIALAKRLSAVRPPPASPGFSLHFTQFRAARAGLFWWCGAAGLLYLGIGAAIAAGALDGSWLSIEWLPVVNLLGLRAPRQARPLQLWWLLGMPWSLLAGSAVWGLAGLLGAFDPGRLRPLRFAAVIFGGALLAWSVSIVLETAAIQAAEEQASGIHRR